MKVYKKSILFFAIISWLPAVLTGCGSGGGSSTIDTSPVATVNYETDAFGCLISDNSETNILYSSTINSFKSKTVIWNCADYNSPSGMQYDKHIEIAFWAYDGICYKHAIEYITNGICDKRALAPQNPVRNIQINNLYMTRDTAVHIGAIIENAGNINIIDAIGYWYLDGSNISLYSGGLTIPIGGPHTVFIGNLSISGLPANTDHSLTLIIQYKDGFTLASREQLISVP